jgi:phosphoglucosamine mutase
MKIFGTDGVRGKANVWPMTPDTLMHLAVAAGQEFIKGDHRHIVVIGKDTRLSGYMIEPALTAGFTAIGMNVVLLGPLPTPAISMLVRSLRADLGVMISASHNPYEDNGVKFFGPDGYKLSADIERAIEKRMTAGELENLAQPEGLGRAQRLDNADGRYIEFVKNTLARTTRFDGLKIVIDCAHGAAYKVAPKVFWELGAEIIPIGVNPDGLNINMGVGAIASGALQEAVVKHKADLGVALDGDADRVVLSDEKGHLIDGDQIMALIATAWQQAGLLRGDKVVGTVMSNLGFENYLNAQNIQLIRTPVGDRHVGEYMRTHDCNVGGEQSGHIILSDYVRTGDGLVAALQVLSVIVQEKRPASEICRMFTPIPQILRNVRMRQKELTINESVQETINTMERTLGQEGRLLVRKSGTEPLIRIMAEGTREDQLRQIIDQIVGSMAREGLIHEPV